MRDSDDGRGEGGRLLTPEPGVREGSSSPTMCLRKKFFEDSDALKEYFIFAAQQVLLFLNQNRVDTTICSHS